MSRYRPRSSHRHRRGTYLLCMGACAVLSPSTNAIAADNATPTTKRAAPPLAVTIVLEDTDASRPLLAQIRTFVSGARTRLDIPIALDAGLASQDRYKRLLDQWRVMVKHEKQRNPQIPVELADDQSNAGFIGPLLVVGQQQIRANLTDEALMRAYRLQQRANADQQAGDRVARTEVPAASPALAPASRGVAGRRSGSPGPGFLYPVAIAVGGLLLWVVWWTGRNDDAPAPRVLRAPRAKVAAPPRSRRRKRR